MPRTKQIRKKSSMIKKPKQSTAITSSVESLVSLASCESPNNALNSFLNKEYDSHEHFIQEFEKYYKSMKEKYHQKYLRGCQLLKEERRKVETALPDSVLKAYIHEEFSEDLINDLNRNLNRLPENESQAMPPPRSRRSISELVPTFDFKKPKTPNPVSKINRNRSSSRKRSSSASAVSRTAIGRSNDVFKTPVMNNRRIMSTATITPKIYSDTPMSVLRRPLHGEVAVSMSGSPLMVSAVSREDVPTVNVPLNDGRVFSIMPEPGAPPLDLPEFDEETKHYLKTLRAHLEILAPNTP